MNKFNFVLLLSLILLAGFATGLFAEDIEYSFQQGPMEKNEVMILFRVVMDPEIDTDFYRQYQKIFFDGGLLNLKKFDEKKVYKNIVGFYMENRFGQSGYYNAAELGYFGGVIIKRPADGQYPVTAFIIKLSQMYLFRISIPIISTITIPEGAKYIYIGTFVFHWEGPTYNLVDAEFLDEFDAAKEFVEKEFGAGNDLIELPLEFELDEEE